MANEETWIGGCVELTIGLVDLEVEQLRIEQQRKNEEGAKAHAYVNQDFQPYTLSDTAMLLLSELLHNRAAGRTGGVQ